MEADCWLNAVEMYKLYQMWEDAIRVAKSHGNQKEIADISVKIAEAMGPELGRQFLITNGLVDAAIDFEANRKNFDEAFNLANQAIYKKPDVHLKYACFLEDEKRYKEAEDHFIMANKPQEAVSMYEHVKDWHSALRVSRQYLPEQVDQVYMSQAKFYMDRQDIQNAEKAYINAKQPEAAVQAWMSIRNYSEAMRVAKHHGLPHLIQQINSIYSDDRGGASAQEIYNSGTTWEQSGNYSRAIDSYLEIQEHHSQDNRFLEDVWMRAYNLAMNYEKGRVGDVAAIVGQRLMQIGCQQQAAGIFYDIGDFESAVDAYMSCGAYD